MGHPSDHVWRNGTRPTAHRGNAFTIRPRIVIEHPKKIFSIHKSHQPRSLRLPDQRRYDGNVKMLTEATTEIPERQRLDSLHIRVRKLTLIFIANAVLDAAITTTPLALISMPALAQTGNQTQTQTQTQSQTRQQLLKDLDAGQVQD